MRLANLSVVLLLRRLSSGVAKRFPTYQHLVQVDIDLDSYRTKFEHYLALSLALSLMLGRFGDLIDMTLTNEDDYCCSY